MENTNYNKDQVFISFRGKDERYRFLALLREKLKDGNVNVFTDEKLVGQPLQNLFKHIENSRIAIVVFSKNYAESDWCLDELAQIKKCVDTKDLKAVIPIFHRVKVAHVKKQSGKFGEKFMALQKSLLAKEEKKKKIKHINSRIKRWKKALNTVTETCGMTYEKNISELDFVAKIVENVKMNLANIAAEERRNFTLESSKKSHEKPAIMITVNINQLNLISRKNMEALNPEGLYADLKPISHDLRRTLSDLDHTDQFAPFSFEAVLVKKKAKNQPSSDKKKSQNINRGGTSKTIFFSALLFVCFAVWIKVNQRNRKK